MRLPPCKYRRTNNVCDKMPLYRRSGKCLRVLHNDKCPEGQLFPFTLKHDSIKWKITNKQTNNAKKGRTLKVSLLRKAVKAGILKTYKGGKTTEASLTGHP